MGKVEHAGRREAKRGDMELLKRPVEIFGTGWGDSSRREVGLGDRELLERSVELGGVGRVLKVNEEAGRAESVSTTDDVGVGRGKRTEKHSPQT